MNAIFAEFYRRRLQEQGIVTEQLADTPPEASQAVDPGVDPSGGVGAPPNTETPDGPLPDPSASQPPTADMPMGKNTGQPTDQPPKDPMTQGAPVVPEPEDPTKSMASTSDQFTEYINEYLKTVAKYANQPSLLMDSLLIARDLPNLSPVQRAFVEMNISAVSLLSERSVADANKSVRKSTDINGMLQAFETQADTDPDLSAAIERLVNLGPNKSNMWRQLLAAVLSGAVLPGPTGGEVACIPKGSEEQINLRPQAYTTWGFVDLGPVHLDGQSIEEYLGEEEQQKLSDGAPEERRVLRNRLFIEAISTQLAGGTWYIVIVNPDDGSWETVNFNSEIFRESYESGKLTVIEAAPEPTGGLAIDDEGNFVTMASW